MIGSTPIFSFSTGGQRMADQSAMRDEPFNLETEAWAYIRALPLPQTQQQMESFVHDWMTKEQQVALGIRYFERDVNMEVRGCDLLEYGCGAGAMCFGFEAKGARVTGIDVDARVLGVARRWAAHRNSKVTFLQSGRELPLA